MLHELGNIISVIFFFLSATLITILGLSFDLLKKMQFAGEIAVEVPPAF